MKEILFCFFVIMITGLVLSNSNPNIYPGSPLQEVFKDSQNEKDEENEEDRKEIKWKDLPRAIRIILKNDYEDWKISKIYKVKESVYSMYYLYYAIELDNQQGKIKRLNLDENGNVL